MSDKNRSRAYENENLNRFYKNNTLLNQVNKSEGLMKDFPLVQDLAISQYDAKLYPSLELVRLEKWFLKSNTKGKFRICIW